MSDKRQEITPEEAAYVREQFELAAQGMPSTATILETHYKTIEQWEAALAKNQKTAQSAGQPDIPNSPKAAKPSVEPV